MGAPLKGAQGREAGVTCAGWNVGAGSVAAKETGFAITEKRMRGVEVLLRCAASAGNTGGDAFSRRGFQDGPDAPLRKRVHVCESEPGVAEEVNRKDGERESEGYVFRGLETVTNLEGQTRSDSAGIGLPARRPSTPSQCESHGGEVGAAVEVVDLGMSPTFNDETSSPEDTTGDYSSVPDVEGTTAVETENMDIEVEPGDSEYKAVTEETEGSAAREEEPVEEVPLCHQSHHEYAELSESRDLNPPSSYHESRRREGKQDASQERPSCDGVIEVEVIEVDDSDDDDDPESDGSSTKGTKPIRRHTRGVKCPSSQFTSASYSPREESDSDECRVMESDSDECQFIRERQPNHSQAWRRQAWTGSKRHGSPFEVIDEDVEDSDACEVVYEDDENSEAEDSMRDDSDSSDVDGSLQESEIRRLWEQAALRKRMGRAMQSEGSKAKGEHGGNVDLDERVTESQGLEESVATSTYHDSPDSKDQTETSGARGGVEAVVNANLDQQGASSRSTEEERPIEKSESDNDIFPSLKENRVEGINTDFPAGLSSRDADLDCPKSRERLIGNSVMGNEAVANSSDDLLAVKEKLKQTPHYRTSDAAEWASRQQEIERQAVESKRLRQRKRLEAERKKEMERKQKQRVEELRLSQMQEERSMSLREQLRGLVQLELENIAYSCHDFATLLRRLGIQVEGGNLPSTLQVNAAYKKALLKFHPDRAVASTQGDPRHQVEAEEKFKLISRLKSTLPPVAIDGPRHYR